MPSTDERQPGCSGESRRGPVLRPQRKHMTEDDVGKCLDLMDSDISDIEIDEECGSDEEYIPDGMQRNDEREIDTDEESDKEPEVNLPLSDLTGKKKSKSGKANSTKKKNPHLKWKNQPFVPPPMEWKGEPYSYSQDTVETPYQIFSKYLSDEFFESVAMHTNLYSVQTTGKSVETSLAEIRSLFAIHIFMGTLKFPRIRMYWSPSTRISSIADSMTVNRFTKLRNNLHLVDILEDNNREANRVWKVQPIMDAVLQRCKQLPLEEELCVDEQIIPFKGRLNIRQYIKNKPTPWGIKVFLLCGKSGIIYHFILYQGQRTQLIGTYQQDFGLGPAVILSLGEHIPTGMNYKLYFDNFFTSIALIQQLTRNGIGAAGTVRKDRLCGCPVKNEKTMKAGGRGTSEEHVAESNDVVITSWMDSKVVTLASNFVAVGNNDNVERWDKVQKKYIEVQHPQVIQHYNQGMGGVDKMDSLISFYRTFIRSRKWTLRVIFHFTDVAICNSWLEYCRDAKSIDVPKKEKMDLLAFREAVAKALLTVNMGEVTKRRGRPSQNNAVAEDAKTPPRKICKREKPLDEARLDRYSHFPELKGSISKLCARKSCGKRTRFFCEKCKVYLCITRSRNCFKYYHVE